jgi:secondary thiamine-phosphate synthase enzyme
MVGRRCRAASVETKADAPADQQVSPTTKAIMFRQAFHELVLATTGRGLIEFTGAVEKWIAGNQFRAGLVTLHLRHTSASLLIQENADPGVRRDLDAFFARLVPDGDPLFIHTAEGDDDMAAHLRTALTAVNLSIPLHGGKLALGTWQGIYLWEHRTRPHSRRVALHFIGE